MAATSIWRFEQLAGDKRVLLLAGADAPHGFPRRGAVVSDGVEVRQELTQYPGVDGEPTRHVFGDRLVPFELKGRFRDRTNGNPGFAKAKTEEVKRFTRDKQPVRVTWGDVVDVNGFITEFLPGREAEREVAWTMRVDVDRDNFAKRRPVVPDAYLPSDAASAIRAALQSLAGGLPTTSLTGLISDVVDSVLGPVNAVLNELDDAANGFASFETATLGQVKRFMTVVDRAAAVCKSYKEVVTTADAAAALVIATPANSVKLWQALFEQESRITDALVVVADLKRRAAASHGGALRRSYRARAGDTWESISTAMYGDPGHAADIQIANSVQGGAKPEPGIEYGIPSA